MMNEEEFVELKMHEKIRLLYQEGAFVTNIRYYGYKINLYLLYNYFVEVFYNHKEDKVEKIELMDRKTSRLKFYTDQISLPVNLL
ncbi:hypothetical protein AB9P05_08865 [Roseivirga sp. BDSF3-8]|uniref:hypothetical protein n=1 Tax=Roseivirga sp. BDSF3-8 TaxID=3241598 RepID=UPI003531D103